MLPDKRVDALGLNDKEAHQPHFQVKVMVQRILSGKQNKSYPKKAIQRNVNPHSCFAISCSTFKNRGTWASDPSAAKPFRVFFIRCDAFQA